jgi:sec-independent protein translocase protein TatA
MGNQILFISGGELVVVVFFILLFFGADSIPGIARMVGKGMREFQKATDDIKREFNDHTADVKNDINKISDNITKQTVDITRKIDEELK